MNKFLKDLENELIKLKVNAKDISEILEDHKEMIEVAQAEGLTKEQIYIKFGDPIKVANEIHSDMKEEPKMSHEFKSEDSCVSYKTDDYNLVKSFSKATGTISFEVSLVSDDLQYTSYDGNDIQVYEKNIEKLDEYEIELNEDVLSLKKKKTMKLLFGNGKSGEFLILVPKTLIHHRIEFNNVSGDANFNGLSTKKLIFKSTNGDIGLSNMSAIETKFSFVNGDVSVTNFKGDTLDVSIINGDLSISDGVFAGDIFFNTVSGNVELTKVECASADLRTVSGDLEGSEFYPKEISLRSVSGDVEIKNEDKSRTIHIKSKKTISGTIEIK